MQFIGATYTFTGGPLAPPSGFQAGDMLRLDASSSQAQLPVKPSDYKLLGLDTSAAARHAAYWKIATGSETAITVQPQPYVDSYTIAAYRGITAPGAVTGSWPEQDVTVSSGAFQLPAITLPTGFVIASYILSTAGAGSFGNVPGWTLDSSHLGSSGPNPWMFAWYHTQQQSPVTPTAYFSISGLAQAVGWGQAVATQGHSGLGMLL